MLRFYADRFVTLTSFVVHIKTISEQVPNEIYIPQKDDPILIEFAELRTLSDELGLVLSVKQIDRITNQLSINKTPATQIKVLLDSLMQRIHDELSSVFLLALPQKTAVDYFEKANLFGEEVFNKFPSANFDIEEAGKCFALARFTACVMHLQRVLEVGLKAYGNLLGIASLANSAQPSWNRILDETRKEIKELNDKQIRHKVWASPEHKEFCEDVQPFLEAVKLAWRNPSMHTDKIYGEEIAEDIFSAVKRFMKHLAAHLDESGNFKS